MNLIIDSGNNYTKIALFERGDMIKSEAISNAEFSSENLRKFLDTYSVPNHAFLSSVSVYEKKIKQQIAKYNIPVVTPQNISKFPIKSAYKDFSALGFDRFAAAVGAVAIFKNRNILIIDAGTALTIDLVTSKGVYKGGSISPGLKLRFEALHLKTGKLPLINYNDNVKLTGNTTESCILSGVVNGMVFEISGFIEQYQKNFEKLKIIITGGDAKILQKPFKKSIFAEPYLVLKGLNEILNYYTSDC